MRAALTRHGYTVLEASHGEEALQILQDHQDDIHLLLTDLVMPGLSGRELSRRLLERRPHARVLLTSGYTDDVVVHRGMIESGMAFIQKPFTLANLLRTVREVLDAQAP